MNFTEARIVEANARINACMIRHSAMLAENVNRATHCLAPAYSEKSFLALELEVVGLADTIRNYTDRGDLS